MPTFTTNYALQKPLVNNATDQDLWGGELNDDLDNIDTLLRAGITIATQSSQTTGFTATVSISVRYLYPCNGTGGAFAATLPAASASGNGSTVFFKKTDSSVNAITITAAGADTIDGTATYAISNQYDVLGLVSNGVDAWALIIKPPVAPIVYPTITGFLPSSISGSSTTAAVTFATGSASDSTLAVNIAKNSTTPWLVSNGNAVNGYAGGTTLPNSSTIHFFVIKKTDGSAVATFASTSLSPTLPASYTFYRRVFSLPTSGAGALLAGNSTEIEGGAQLFYLISPPTDVSATTPASATLYALSVPTGLKVRPITHSSGDAVGSAVIITSPDETDTAPSSSIADLGQASGGSQNQAFITTNTSGQIRLRATSTSGTTYVTTRGWVDFRRS